MSHRHIGLWAAILLSLNIMVGAGAFVNLSTLTKLAGPWGFLGYLFGAIILLPVVISLATLASLHAVAGGLLVYGKEYLHPIAGFISSWSYFLGKCVAVALFADAFINPFYLNYAFMQGLPKLVWMSGFLLFLALVNIGGVRLSGRIQWLFTGIKVVPIVAVIASAVMRGGWGSGGLWAFNGGYDIAGLIPVALFALSGFEVICNLGHQIIEPQRNALRIALASSLFVALLYMALQLAAFALAGTALTGPHYLTILGFSLYKPFSALGFMLNDLIYAIIFSSAFNIMINSSWNLYAIAQDRFFPASAYLTRCTLGGVPWVAHLLSITLSIVILMVTTDLVALQNISVLGTIVAYFISTLSALVAFYRNPIIAWAIPAAGLFSCAYVLNLCITNLMASGLSAPVLAIFSVGLVMAVSRFVARRMSQYTYKNN